MPILYRHPASTKPGAPKRYTRRATLNGALKLVTAGWVVGGPLGSLAACASGVPSQQAPTPSPPQLRRITPENAHTIRTIATLQSMDRVLRGVAVSPDAALIATGGTTDVQLWDARSGTTRKKLVGHTEQVYGMAWSSASGLLASGSFDGTARVWNVLRDEAVQTLNCGNSSVFSVAWSPDGRLLACGVQDGRVFIWDATTATQRAIFTGPGGQSKGGGYPFAAWGVAWAPDGSHVVSTRYDDLLLVWDLSTGASRAIPKTDSQPNTLAWAPNGRSSQ
jgi:WD40 repeat protein